MEKLPKITVEYDDYIFVIKSPSRIEINGDFYDNTLKVNYKSQNGVWVKKEKKLVEEKRK
jgi:hypothetical protein